MRKIRLVLFAVFLIVVHLMVQGQSILQMGNTKKVTIDSTKTVAHPLFYRTAEIAFEIENTSRYIKTTVKQIDSYRKIADIDSSFQQLSAHLKNEFDDFNSFNKVNLSKFFLLNTKRVWLSYRSQLNNWQTEISSRIQNLIDVSDQVKVKKEMWDATAKQPGNQLLPEEIKGRISNVLLQLDTLETKLFGVVGDLSVLDSRIADQIIAVDSHIEVIDELHKNYRQNILKANRPALWNVTLKGSYEGSVGTRLKKAWYENTKSLKDSLPSFMEYFDNFLFRSLFIILIIFVLRYFYIKQKLLNKAKDKKDIRELIIRHPVASTIYMVLFVFILTFSNIPLAFWGIISLLLLIITYFILRYYVVSQGQRIIKTFIVMLALSILEIVFWYFGGYARLYLLFEACLGLILVSHFISPNYKKKVIPGFRYKQVVKVLRYPIFLFYLFSAVVNLFGFQNLTVLFLKIGTQVSSSIIIIIGAWEISKSILATLIEVLNRFKGHKTYDFFPVIVKRLTFFLNLFFALVWFHTLLVILELDTPFYEGLTTVMSSERRIGSFVFTYDAIFQFILIMFITYVLTYIIRIIFNDGNFKKTQRLRGVPAALSMTFRLIVAITGFFLALTGAGIDLTNISIMIGAFSVGIGFGLQNIVNNFISGLILIYERPIQVGDTIEINSLMGEVKSIGIRSSHVKTYDGAEVVVPNSILVSDQLINWTLSDDKRRIEIIVGVKYGTDPLKVIEILKHVANQHELVVKDPEPRVLFNEFADSSLNFRLLCWVLFEHGIQTKSELSIAIDKAFKENNIEIPFPQLDLHVVDTPAEKGITGKNT